MRTTRNTDQAIAGPTRFTGPRNIGTGANPGLVPALGLDFLVDYLTPAVSFSRASNATMFDSAGNLVWAPHNLCTRGNDFSVWAATSDATATAAGFLPSGRQAWSLVWQSATPSSGAALVSQSVLVGAPTAITIKVKALNHPWIRVAMYSNNNNGNQVRGWFNVQTGAWGSVVAAGATSGASADAPIDIGNGWYQITLRGTVPWASATDGALLVATAAANGDVTREGSGAGFYVGEAVFEVVGAQTPQAFRSGFDTAGSPYYGPRLDYNPATLEPRGLLNEASRTNNLERSDSPSGTAGTNSVAPSPFLGWASARRFTGDGTLATHFVSSNGFLPAASAVYTISVYVRYVDTRYVQLCTTINASNATDYVNFDLVDGVITATGATASGSISPVSGGYRLTFTWTSIAVPASGAAFVMALLTTGLESRFPGNTVSTSVDFMGAQYEAGNFATSLIPTFGTPATRAADIADLVSDPPWNQAGTSYYTEYERQGTPVNSTPEATSSVFYFGGASNLVQNVFGISSANQQRVDMAAAAVTQAQLTAGGGLNTPFTVYKFAARLSENDARLAVNGSLGTQDTVVTMPVALDTTRKTIGRGSSSTVTQMHGWLRGLRVYTQALDDTTLQALTS